MRKRLTPVPALLGVGLALVLASCGDGPKPPTQPAKHRPTTTAAIVSTPTPSPDPTIAALAGRVMHVHYVGKHVAIDVVLDERGRTRVDYVIDPNQGDAAERITMVWDGTKVLSHDADSEPEYTLFNAPAEHRNAVEMVHSFRFDPSSPTFAKICPSAGRGGSRSIAGRRADGYSCGGAKVSEAKRFVLWLDRATGVLLDTGQVRADRVTMTRPSKGDRTFSTQPPSGAKVQVVAAHGGTGKGAPTFSLPGVHGGTVRLSDYAGHPVVLAIFMSDLAFEHADCAECKSLATLAQLSDSGRSPRVLGVLGGDPGKPGTSLVPSYVTFPVASDAGFTVQASFGLSDRLGFVFIRSDGSVQATYDRAMTAAELNKALTALAAT